MCTDTFGFIGTTSPAAIAGSSATAARIGLRAPGSDGEIVAGGCSIGGSNAVARVGEASRTFLTGLLEAKVESGDDAKLSTRHTLAGQAALTAPKRRNAAERIA